MPKRYRASSSQLRVIVLGYVVRGPVGGFASYFLQYVMGLTQLGHNVYFLEVGDDYPSCYDPSRNLTSTDPTYGLRFATDVFDRTGLGSRWAYHDARTSSWLGPCADRVAEACLSADLLLNIGGVNRLDSSILEAVPVRALVDLDPVFTQVKHLMDSTARDRAMRHTAFFTIGENFGRPGSSVPDDGLPWQTTRQPVVLDAWPFTPGPENGKFTTVMQWESYPAMEYRGIRHGLKSDSFGPYWDLPDRVGRIFELAVGGPAVPSDLLRTKGWGPRNPLEVTQDPWTYQRYIQQSKGEFSVAKHAYATTHSGWFSDRSVGYLASGRPVLMQETGFSDWLPTGEGLMAFSSPQEVLNGLEEIQTRYQFHCRSARELAEAYFDSRTVLSRLIDDAMNSASACCR
jgi:hypothetical protein